MAHVDRREYWQVFVWLAVLTVVEVGAVYLHLPVKWLVAVLIGFALGKAAIVGLYYMHLNHETKWLKLTVAIPMAIPALYAVVLVGEGAWRGAWMLFGW